MRKWLLPLGVLLLGACAGLAVPLRPRLPVGHPVLLNWTIQRQVNELLLECPPSAPVLVLTDRLMATYGWYGVSWLEGGVWHIVLDEDNSPDMQQAVLVHEWAHILAGAGAAHGDEWGRVLARVTRAWYDLPE